MLESAVYELLGDKDLAARIRPSVRSSRVSLGSDGKYERWSIHQEWIRREDVIKRLRCGLSAAIAEIDQVTRVSHRLAAKQCALAKRAAAGHHFLVW
jgi:hypothetical protein